MIAYHRPGTILSTRDSAVNRRDKNLYLQGDFISGKDGRGEKINDMFKIQSPLEGISPLEKKLNWEAEQEMLEDSIFNRNVSNKASLRRQHLENDRKVMRARATWKGAGGELAYYFLEILNVAPTPAPGFPGGEVPAAPPRLTDCKRCPGCKRTDVILAENFNFPKPCR